VLRFKAKTLQLGMTIFYMGLVVMEKIQTNNSNCM